MEDDNEHCGLVCSEIINKQQQILDEINKFSNYNKEFALVMIGRIMDMVYVNKDKLNNINLKEQPHV